MYRFVHLVGILFQFSVQDDMMEDTPLSMYTYWWSEIFGA